MTTSADMLIYMKFRGDLPFWKAAYNEVDVMILTQLSSIDYRDTMPGARNVDELAFCRWSCKPLLSEVAQKYKKRKQEEQQTVFSEKEQLLFLAGESRRFSKIRMDGFIRDTDMEKVKQFSAVTFFFSPIRAHVAFRGTDDSFVAWKEDFNMSYQFPVPAQEDAAKYLDKLLGQPFLWCTAGGHSKGGNMTLYAAVFCSPGVQKKIKKIFCYDAPGFSQDISENPSYIKIKNRIRAYVPKSTVIGTIMKVPFEAGVVESNAIGIRQHGLFSWQVEASGLVLCGERDAFSRSMENAINEWLDEIPTEDKPIAIDEAFEILRKNEIKTMDGLAHLDWRKTVGLFRGATKMSAKNRERLFTIIKRIREESKRIASMSE